MFLQSSVESKFQNPTVEWLSLREDLERLVPINCNNRL